MSEPLQKFRFTWRANAKNHETVIEASDYPLACWKLALIHSEWFGCSSRKVPADFELDLSKPEIVG